MTSFIYPCIVYWGWSGSGLLNYEDAQGEAVSIVGPPLIDFAGSGIVHLSGGMAAFMGVIIVGGRQHMIDKWNKQKEREDRRNGIGGGESLLEGDDAQNAPARRRKNDSDSDSEGETRDTAASEHEFEPKLLQEPYLDGMHMGSDVLGTIILWFGWYGFNPGSTAAMKTMDDAFSAGLVTVNTSLAPCTGGLVVIALRAWEAGERKLDVEGLCNGCLAGLVSITAGCASVRPWEAACIGLIGGFVYQGCSMALKKYHVDDVVDAVPVHGGCGLWGILALGFFGSPADGMGGNGVLHGGDQLWTQIVVCILICSWVGITSASVFLPLFACGLLRLPDKSLMLDRTDPLKLEIRKIWGDPEEELDVADFAGTKDPDKELQYNTYLNSQKDMSDQDKKNAAYQARSIDTLRMGQELAGLAGAPL